MDDNSGLLSDSAFRGDPGGSCRVGHAGEDMPRSRGRGGRQDLRRVGCGTRLAVGNELPVQFGAICGPPVERVPCAAEEI